MDYKLGVEFNSILEVFERVTSSQIGMNIIPKYGLDIDWKYSGAEHIVLA